MGLGLGLLGCRQVGGDRPRALLVAPGLGVLPDGGLDPGAPEGAKEPDGGGVARGGAAHAWAELAQLAHALLHAGLVHLLGEGAPQGVGERGGVLGLLGRLQRQEDGGQEESG